MNFILHHIFLNSICEVKVKVNYIAMMPWKQYYCYIINVYIHLRCQFVIFQTL